MSTIVKKIYNTSGLYSLKLPGVLGQNQIVQIETHGGGGGGTAPVGSLAGSTGGYGQYQATMMQVPGGSTLEIGVPTGGGAGQVDGQESNYGIIEGSNSGYGGYGGYGGLGHCQGGGGGALATVLLWFSGSYYGQLTGSWPKSSESPVTQNQTTALLWAGGGGGGGGALNTNIHRGTNGLSAGPVNNIHGRTHYYYGGFINGQLVDYCQTIAPSGNSYGGGGAGGFADTYPYALFDNNFYRHQYNFYTGPGTGGHTYYSGKSAGGGAGGKSGANGYFMASNEWYETPNGQSPLSPTLYGKGYGLTNWHFNNLSLTQADDKFVQGISKYGFGGAEASDGGNGRVIVQYVKLDNQPNDLDAFITEYDAEINTLYTTRNEVSILGLGTGISTPARIIAPTLNDYDEENYLLVNGTAFLLQTTQFINVQNGDKLKLRVKSSPRFNEAIDFYLRVGPTESPVESRYTLVTKARVPPVANTFSFPPVYDAYPGALVTSDRIIVTGNYDSAPISVSATDSEGFPVEFEIYIDDTSRNPGDNLVILNGSTLQLKVRAGGPNTVSTVRVVIGDGSPVDWLVYTMQNIDTGPDFYNFLNEDNATGGTEVLSNIVTITGINYAAVLSASNTDNVPVYANINGGIEWFNISAEPIEILNDSTVQLKITASITPNTSIDSTIVIGTNQYGSLSDKWKVTTNTAGDTFPDQFTFADRLNQKATTVVYSNSITVKGTTSPAPLSVSIPSDFVGSQAQFSINGGNDWFNLTPGGGHPSSAPLTIVPNGTLILRLRTGSYGANSSIINVDIGGRTDQWSVTPLSEAPVTDSVATWYSALNSKPDGYTIGTVISIFRDNTGAFGNLDGSPESRYPGFIECDGRELLASEYPDLFDVVGNIYGGTGLKSAEPPYEYSGVFRIPDYRNRKLYGTGRLDGNLGSSPAVPTFIGPDGEGTGSSTTVGSQGGFWYIEKIDPKGPYPREQLYEDEISGEFFGLGTIKTSGYSSVTAPVLFNITGSCTGEVGPLRETILKTPQHSHELLSSQVLDTTNGLIAWGTPALLPTGRISGNNNFSGVYPGAPNAPVQRGGGDWSEEVTYSNYWSSAKRDSAKLDNTGGTTRLGAIDCGPNTEGRVQQYNPGGTLSHTHYIGNTPFASTNTFSYGNVNGPGTMYGGGATTNTVPISFSAGQVSLLSEPGTFTLSNRKAIVPTVKFRPNATIPLISKYYRAKYIIKAF